MRSVRFGRGVLFEGSPPGGCRDAAAARSGPGAARGSSVRPAARFPKQDGSAEDGGTATAETSAAALPGGRGPGAAPG
ncbi:hypothetical protein HDA36_005209 [Nocardiopsis composta]|uniref:Uncharacterized protein n=1 Tax=Nocardiopsis composta TaxID=157465 RepID=A0A7W8QR84_9ACTN|nr:hypothetical protein [Nocardiopsis composta]